jgi:RNA polymerase sigma-70 factor (ECF subfamily)
VTDFATAYARFSPPIQAKCRRLLGSSPAAEDVAQEAFLRFWRSGLAEGDDVRTMMAWLYRTATRLAIDVMRERRRMDVGGAEEARPCGVDVAACAEARSVIQGLAGKVPEEELAVAVTVRIDGLAHPDAAALLGISERTVRRMLARFDERTASLRQEYSS